jgi:3',5'-cyclic-AMP phosphodiesterase
LPFTVVQLSDPHIGADWSEDPATALARAITDVGRVLAVDPDAVVVSGDIANSATDAEYNQAHTLLSAFDAPVYVLPGNHDDREALRRHFDFPGAPDAGHLSYAVDLGQARLVCLDTQRPGRDGGQLDADRLAWLDATLIEDTATPTLLAMHHPPLVTGIPSMDSIAMPSDERWALARIVEAHRQVQVIAAGHVHRAIIGALGGTPVVAIPSTDAQLAFDTEAPDIRFVPEPPCFAIHLLVDGRFVSHLQPVIA